MEQTIISKQTPDPASTPEAEKKRDYIGRQFPNQMQFEEAVQRLQEEYERHPHPAKGMFY